MSLNGGDINVSNVPLSRTYHPATLNNGLLLTCQSLLASLYGTGGVMTVTTGMPTIPVLQCSLLNA